MKEITDNLKTSAFSSECSKSRFTAQIYTPFENYIEYPEKGRLFGILNLNSVKDFDCAKAVQILKSVVVSKYYSSEEKSNIDNLEYTISYIKSELSQMVSNRLQELEGSLDLNCILLSFKDNICYIANFGDNEVFLYREDKEHNLNIHLRDTLGRNQVRVASILLEPGDQVFSTTPNTLNRIISPKLKNCIETFNFEKLNSTPLRNESLALSILSVGYKIEIPIEEKAHEPVKLVPPKPEPKPKPSLYPNRVVQKEMTIEEKEPPIQREVINEIPKSQVLTPHQRLNFSQGVGKANTSQNSTERAREGLNNLNVQNPVSSLKSRPLKGLYTEVDIGTIENNDFSRKVEQPNNFKTNTYKEPYSPRFQSSSTYKYDELEIPPAFKKKTIKSASKLNLNKVTSVKDITIFAIFIKIYQNIRYFFGVYSKVILNALLQKKSKSFEKKVRIERNSSSNPYSQRQERTTLKNPSASSKLKIIYLVPILVIIILGGSLYISNSMKLDSEKKAKEAQIADINSRLKAVSDIISQADSLANTNKSRSRSLLVEADAKLKELEKLNMSDYNSKINDLKKNSEIILTKKIEKYIAIEDSNILQDLASIYQSPNIIGMEISGGKLYVAFADGRLLESTDIGTANLSFINVLQNFNKIQISKITSDTSGNIMLFDNSKGMYKYDPKAKNLTEITNLTTNVIGGATGFLSAKINNREYLYYLNNTTKQLLRSFKSGDAYSNPEVRISNESFSTATSISIDGRIWVSSAAGLKKFYDGVEEPVKFNQNTFDFAIGQISQVKATNDKILFTDNNLKRLMVFAKIEALSENSLSYVASYIFKGSKIAASESFVDFDIDNNFIYILSNSKLFKVSYTIPTEYMVGI